jgi:hypothetical protein
MQRRVREDIAALRRQSNAGDLDFIELGGARRRVWFHCVVEILHP